ncbi:MAG TPA: hypothetical protein VK435_02385 [Thermodesulfovibrionales bacterium]|nr:hypothetical protein [Thermodesulfovibrionales bacterium]
MKSKLLPAICGIIMLWAVPAGSAEAPEQECNPEEIFQSCDTNKDGIISLDEWAALDADKNKTITNEEWDKYRYKSENKTKAFQVKFFSVYGNGMNREEFMQNFKRLR